MMRSERNESTSITCKSILCKNTASKIFVLVFCCDGSGNSQRSGDNKSLSVVKRESRARGMKSPSSVEMFTDVMPRAPFEVSMVISFDVRVNRSCHTLTVSTMSSAYSFQCLIRCTQDHG